MSYPEISYCTIHKRKADLWDCVARNNDMTPAWINHVGEACADTVPRCEGRGGAASKLRWKRDRKRCRDSDFVRE
jgi:hypothetical protein